MELLTSDQLQIQNETDKSNPAKIVSDSLPILHLLRTRIRAYAKLWCIAGAMTLLLSLPAMREKNILLACATMAAGLSVLFFALMRIIESKSVSALIEVDRSDIPRKVWLALNSLVFFSALVIFSLCIFSSRITFNPWTALPISSFLMIVSASPFWEWFFVRRVIRNNKDLLEEFNFILQGLYKKEKEREIALLSIDALMMLESLRDRKALSNTTYQIVLKELLRLDPVI